MRAIIAVLVLLAIVSCSKTSGEKDTEPPVVALATPANNQILNGSQAILISGSVSDNRYIKQIHIEVANFHTGAEYRHIHIHPASASAAFNETFTVEPGITYRIRAIADDASANSSMKEVTIIVNN
ncbi:MAG TPA: hypothetical protein PKC69_01440 [Chitinophagaceae bacterium]|nr:hypothetical protein [Chitinophagaceae bacterium]